MSKMKWLKDKVVSIAFCVGGGYLLRFFNENLEASYNHILQNCLIFAFVIIAFWKNKPVALTMFFFTTLALGFIELYASQLWYNSLRAVLVFFLLLYLLFWTRFLEHKQKLQE